MTIIAQVPRLFNIEVARGGVPGYAHEVITSVNPSVGSAFEDLWDFGGNFSYPISGEQWEVVSSNANDTSAGTGAKSVVITGLDDNYVEQVESVNLNGTTPVSTTNTDWFRIRTAVVESAGTNQENVGSIILRISGGGTVRSMIREGIGQTFNGLYTVPAGKTLIVQYTQAVIPKNQDVIIQSRVLVSGTNTFIGGPGLPIYQNNVDTTFTSHPILPEKTDLRITAKSTNDSVSVAVLVEGIVANTTSLGGSTVSIFI